MAVSQRFERLAAVAARRPVLTISIVVALAVAGGLLALGLKPSAGTDTFVGRSTASYKATADDQRHFGDDSVVILIKESLPNLVETKDLALDSRITSLPSIASPQYTPQVLFDQPRGVNQPKARFAYLFSTKDSALIQVRLKSSLRDAQQVRAISLIRQATRMPMFRSA